MNLDDIEDEEVIYCQVCAGTGLGQSFENNTNCFSCKGTGVFTQNEENWEECK